MNELIGPELWIFMEKMKLKLLPPQKPKQWKQRQSLWIAWDYDFARVK